MREQNTNTEEGGRGRIGGLIETAMGAAAFLEERRFELILWSVGAVGIGLAMLLFDAGTALAQAGGEVDTCAGDTGGAGGQQILDAGKKLVSYGGILVGVVVAGGMLGAGMMTAGGSISEVWQKRGSRAAAAVLIGGLIALGGSAFFSLLDWATCGAA